MSITFDDYGRLLLEIDKKRSAGWSPEELTPMITQLAKMELRLHKEGGYSWDQMRLGANASMRKAREEHAQQQQEHALKMAHKELKVLKGEEVGVEVSSREARLREAAERAAADKEAAKVIPPFGKFDPRV